MSKHKELKKKTNLISGIDLGFLGLVIFILALGMLAMASAGYITAHSKTGDSAYFIKHQFFGAALGIVLMGVAMIMSEKMLKFLTPFAYIASIGLLGFALIYC